MSLTASQVRPAVKIALEAAAPFAAAHVQALPFNGEMERDNALEGELTGLGLVLALTPLLGTANESRTDGRVLERAVFAVNVRTNPTKNDADDGAGIDHDDACDAVIAALLKLAVQNRDFAKLQLGNGGPAIRELLRDGDAGLLTHAIYYSVPIVIAAPAAA